MALGLGLPEETLVEEHDFDEEGHSSRKALFPSVSNAMC
jgi:hypothetical protein